MKISIRKKEIANSENCSALVKKEIQLNSIEGTMNLYNKNFKLIVIAICLIIEIHFKTFEKLTISKADDDLLNERICGNPNFYNFLDKGGNY